MKRSIMIACLALTLLLLLSSCGRVYVSSDQLAELTYQYGDVSVSSTLTKEESELLLSIVGGKMLYADDPSCGFDVNISFKISDRIFCPACDSCCTIKDCKTGKYFSISDSERETIESIFEKYGGKFPCV